MANEITPNNVFTRTNLATGAIPAKAEQLIMEQFTKGSWVLNNSTLVDMKDIIKTFYYTTGPTGAYWVSETETIKTTKPSLVRAEMRAHKMAVIIPASEEELNFENPNLFEELAPRIAESFYRELDRTAILGVTTDGKSPFAFSIDASARKSLNVIEGAITEDNMLDLESLVEEEHELTDYLVSGKTIAQIKKVTDNKGNKIYDKKDAEFDGIQTTAFKGVGIPTGTVYAVDKSKTFVGIPKGFEYKVLDQGTLSSLKNADGSVVNLAEQDMKALRVTFYVGFLVGSDSAFAVLEAETPEVPEG